MPMYLVLMSEPDHFDQWDASTDAEQQQVFDAYAAFVDAIRAHGSVRYGDALARPELAVTLRPGRGADRIVGPGPYADPAEQAHGLYVVEMPDLESTVEAARRLPQSCTVEVRPLLDVYRQASEPE